MDESKDKSKKEKDNQRDMKSKEEEKKSLKRKNDGSEQNSPIRKQKEGTFQSSLYYVLNIKNTSQTMFFVLYNLRNQNRFQPKRRKVRMSLQS